MLDKAKNWQKLIVKCRATLVWNDQIFQRVSNFFWSNTVKQEAQARLNRSPELKCIIMQTSTAPC